MTSARGYASLTHLLSFPVDIIKIDKSFVECLEGREAGRVIVKGLLDIAKGLGMRIVAEGCRDDKAGIDAATSRLRPWSGLPIWAPN